MDSASSSTSGAQNRQKRVLPSRSRRGGPGVGTCEVDILILETLKRRCMCRKHTLICLSLSSISTAAENEPLIPANTSFILTTNSKYASNDPGGAITVNMVANDRYFDRPEVVKAFREQAIIQTPEFSSIGESSNVGGRFRPRAAEDVGPQNCSFTPYLIDNMSFLLSLSRMAQKHPTPHMRNVTGSLRRLKSASASGKRKNSSTNITK